MGMMKFARIGGNSVKKASVNYDLCAKDRLGRALPGLAGKPAIFIHVLGAVISTVPQLGRKLKHV